MLAHLGPTSSRLVLLQATQSRHEKRRISSNVYLPRFLAEPLDFHRESHPFWEFRDHFGGRRKSPQWEKTPPQEWTKKITPMGPGST